MVLHNSKTRNMVRAVNKSAVKDIEERIDQVQDWTSVGRREKARVIEHLKEAKQALLDGHEDLMVFFQRTK